MASALIAEEVKQAEEGRFINVFDYENGAKEKLSGPIFDYFAGGSADEITLRENREAFDRIKLQPRILKGVGQRDLSTTVLGHKISFPFLISPVSFLKFLAEEGACAVAETLEHTGIMMSLSSFANESIEDVVKAAKGRPVFFQLYVYKDRQATKELIQRVETAGAKAIVLSADIHVVGKRERDKRNRFALPKDFTMHNIPSKILSEKNKELFFDNPIAFAKELFEANLSWQDVDWIKKQTKLPLIIKGVLSKEDAKEALNHNVAALIVSNHGGRQLDTVPATIEVLPEIVEAVGGSIEVLMNGGIRRGTDILKALALGAKAVLAGRPIAWGLACEGKKGVANVIELLKDEFDIAMALSGCRNVSEIKRTLIRQ